MSKSQHQERQAHRVPPYRRPLVVGGVLLIIAVIGVATAVICKNVIFHDDSGKSSQNSEKPSSDQTKPQEPEPSPDVPLEDKAPQYEGEDPNTLDELTGNIAYREVDPSTQTLRVAVMINQYLQENGQCVLNIKRGDTIMRTVSALAIPDVTSSTCGSLETSIEGLSPGSYQLEIILTGDNKKGTISDTLEI